MEVGYYSPAFLEKQARALVTMEVLWRADPYGRHYRIRLPPRVNGGEATAAASRTHPPANNTLTRR